MTKPDRKERWIRIGWWAIWGFAFVISLLPPFAHRSRNIAEIIEPLRYPWGLLPAELLFLRHLGELSHWIPAILLGLLALAISKQHARRGLIAFGALISALFSSIYAAYCVTIVSMYLVGYSEVVRELDKAEQDVAPQSANRSELDSEGGDKPQPETKERSR